MAAFDSSESESLLQALRAANMRGQWENEAHRTASDRDVEKGVFGPKPGGVPHVWPWATVKPFLERSCKAIPETFTSRRSLMFNNPGLPRGTTTSINMGIQMILPGELAWAHRHSISALRFVISAGPSLSTVVSGVPLPMSNYDLVLTPAWEWHDHHNAGDQPGVWLDVLDGPIMNSLNQVFFENFGPDRQPLANSDTDVLSSLHPPENLLETERIFSETTKIYPWRETEKRLQALSEKPASPYDGVVYEYVDPVSQRSVLPSLSCWAQLLRPGEKTQAHRHTSSSVYFVVRGNGRTIVDDVELTWGPNDCFVVPNWAWHEHRNVSSDQDAVLFSVNDIPLLAFLGLYREEPDISIRELPSHQTRRKG
jgi:1-hydroxy-2-naphthoate dioxygenase